MKNFSRASKFAAFGMVWFAGVACSRGGMQNAEVRPRPANSSDVKEKSEFEGLNIPAGHEKFDEFAANRSHGTFARQAYLWNRQQNALPTEEQLSFDVLSYDLEGEIQWQKNALNASVTVKFKARSQNLLKLDLDSEVARVKSVTWLPSSGGKVTGSEQPLFFEELKDNKKLSINLQPINGELPLVPGESYFVKITYEASRSGNLTLVSPRETDPVKSRVAYTTAEPLGAATWMPCHNTPNDRALFRAEFSMPADESFIANGRLEFDRVRNKKRSMRYSTEYSLPTYLMAFAVGQLQWTTTNLGKLPVSVVHRRGATVNADSQLKALTTLIPYFEKKLVPYPFEKYALVLLPEFGAGGIEHAGITFQAEHRSTDARVASDFGLTAHELAHQWFGDLVTVASWDDLWLKEGMATFLSADAMKFWDRSLEQSSDEVSDFGAAAFGFVNGEAARDPNLSPGQKYNSGPYERGAWVFTQLRRRLGEEKFWNYLQAVLQNNSMRSIGFHEMKKELVPFADQETILAFNRAVRARKAPQVKLDVSQEQSQSVRKLRVDVTESQGALFHPFSLWVYRAKSVEAPEIYIVGANAASSISIELADGDSVFWDPQNEHAPLDSFVSKPVEAAEAFKLLAQLSVPARVLEEISAQSSDLKETRVFLQALPPQAQRKAYANFSLISPDAYAVLAQNITGTSAKSILLTRACNSIAASQPNDALKSEWRKSLGDSLYNPPALAGTDGRKMGALAGCALLFENGELRNTAQVRLAEFLADGANPIALMQLASFQLAEEESISYWKKVALAARTLRARSNAVGNILNVGTLSPEVLRVRTNAIRDIYFGNRTLEITRSLWQPVISNLEPRDVLRGAFAVLGDSSAYRVHVTAFCNGYRTAKTPELKEFFFLGLPSAESVDNFLKPYFSNPEKCL